MLGADTGDGVSLLSGSSDPLRIVPGAISQSSISSVLAGMRFSWFKRAP